MMSAGGLSAVGVDGVALKPSEVDVRRADAFDVPTITVDYEGREHVPDPDVLADLAASFDVRATVPVRADGFDPLGDSSIREVLPESVGEVLVAGHRAYLSDCERRRRLAPRLEAAIRGAADPWVGTEGIERLALAVGGTQFELLSAHTRRQVRSLRETGFEGEIAVYAPTDLTDDPDTILDSVGDYAARRQRVRERLPADTPTDSTITETPREQLLAGCRDCALVGDGATVSERIDDLRDAGVDRVVAYPARGVDAVGT